MKRIPGLLLLILAPLLASAQSGLDGTWRIDVTKAQIDQKPTIFELKNGMFVCSTCDPKLNIKANGQEQKVAGSPYVDMEKISMLSGRTVERVGSKDGKVRFRATYTVSADGRTLTEKYEGHPANSAQAVVATTVYSRVGEPESGAHAISGAWKGEKYEGVSDNALTFSYSMNGDGLNYKASTGESYSAKFDGKDYPFHGDPGTTEVVLKKLDDHTFEETYKRNGEVVGKQRMTISSDGKSMNIVAQDTRRGTTDTFVAGKKEGSDTMADK